MGAKLIEAPAMEPVTLAEAKLHLRVIDSSDDALIGTLITAARAHAENVCRRAFVTQKWVLYLDAFPAGKIQLPFPTLQSVESVKYRDTDGALVTLDAAQYVVDAISEPGAVTPAYGASWPFTQAIPNAVQISYTAGYGEATDVPAEIKVWMLVRVGALYENREEVAAGQSLVALPIADRLLDRYRIQNYA